MQVVPTTPMGGPPGSTSGLHSKWGGGNVVDTEVRYGQRSGSVQMKVSKSMERILQRKNGYGGGGEAFEREPLIDDAVVPAAGGNGGIIGGELRIRTRRAAENALNAIGKTSSRITQPLYFRAFYE